MEEDTPRSKLTCLGRHVGAMHGEELGNREENPNQAQVFLPCMRGKVCRTPAFCLAFLPYMLRKTLEKSHIAVYVSERRFFPTCLEKSLSNFMIRLKII